jgi:uncharacterized repeat protein (TIGR01451 family)
MQKDREALVIRADNSIDSGENAASMKPFLVVAAVLLLATAVRAQEPAPSSADAWPSMPNWSPQAAPNQELPAVESPPAAPQDPPTPVVSIRVRVAANVDAGHELEYRICVENKSAAAAHHVIVTNPLPANAKFVRSSPEPNVRTPELVWRLGTLEAGKKQEIVLVVLPTGGEDLRSCARVQFEHGECVTTKIAKPALRLQKDGPKQAVLYDALSYKLTVTNAGNADATNVTLTDVLPVGLEHSSHKDRLNWIIGTLPPGQSRSVEYQVIAKTPGKLCNKVIATAGTLREEMESCVTVGEAKLELGMTGPARRYVNTPAGYQITVSNPGTVTLEHVVVAESLPESATFVSASAGGQQTEKGIQWSLDSLPPGASKSVEFVLRARAEGRICNRATATADRGLSTHREFCTDFYGEPALSLHVEDSEDPVEVGATTEYNIAVRNQGTSPTTHVRILATAPVQEDIVQASGPSNNLREARRVIFEPLTLPAGGEARYRVTVKAQQPGEVRFKVELTADQLIAGPVLQEESTTIYAVLPSSRRKIARGVQPSSPKTAP